MKILMVCIGNICRSPIAEGVMRTMIQEKNLPWEVSSAGIASYHIGEPPHHYSQKICQNHGIDISHQRASLLTSHELGSYDIIYAMSTDVLQSIRETLPSSFREEKFKLFLSELYPFEKRSVPDPWYGNEEGYADVYNMIETTCKTIIDKYNKK
jgi:protein-tyrosine phosphatase